MELVKNRIINNLNNLPSKRSKRSKKKPSRVKTTLVKLLWHRFQPRKRAVQGEEKAHEERKTHVENSSSSLPIIIIMRHNNLWFLQLYFWPKNRLSPRQIIIQCVSSKNYLPSTFFPRLWLWKQQMGERQTFSSRKINIVALKSLTYMSTLLIRL
jgi:hypothetical protein